MSDQPTNAEEPAKELPAELLPPPEAAPAAEAKDPTPAVEPGASAPAGDGQAVSNGAATDPGNKRWYVVKVQSGREESIKEAIERRVKIEGLEEYFGQIVIPVERVTEMRNNKRITRERKLYPGYLMVEVEYNDRILYLFRETSGVGDFVGGSIHHPPPPMSEREIDRMKHQQAKPGEAVAAKPGKSPFERGDRVKVREGTFAGMEGEVKDILEAKGLVRVEITIFGRPVPVELEYWQVDHT
jgi:transcription termination/antitermination protein NusG